MCISNVLAVCYRKMILVHAGSFYLIYSKYSMDPCWWGCKIYGYNLLPWVPHPSRLTQIIELLKVNHSWASSDFLKFKKMEIDSSGSSSKMKPCAVIGPDIHSLWCIATYACVPRHFLFGIRHTCLVLLNGEKQSHNEYHR